MNEKTIAIILIVLFFIATSFFMFNGGFTGSNDSSEWEHMAKDPTYNKYYSSLLRPIATIFTENKINLVWLWLIITSLLTPLAIYWLSKKWISIIFYFTITNYFYAIIGAGLFAQGLAILLLICFLATNKWWLKLMFFVLGVFSHSTGPYLFSFTLFFVIIEYLIKNNFKLKEKFILVCSPLFGTKSINVINTNVGLISNAPWSLTIKDIGSFFMRACPFPFLFTAFRSWWKEKNLTFFALFIVAFVFAFIQNNRSLLLVCPLMVVGFSKQFYESRFKKYWILLAIFFGLFNLQQYWWAIYGIGC